MTRQTAEFILEQIEATLRGDDADLAQARRLLREEIGEVAPAPAEQLCQDCGFSLVACKCDDEPGFPEGGLDYPNAE